MSPYIILGKRQESPVHQDLLFACYRNGFSSCDGFTDDVGWGCTLRSFQMVLSNALSSAGVSHPEQYIMDDPTTCPFALQHLVSVGKKVYKIRAGEWFTPSMGARALYECCPSDLPLSVRLHGEKEITEDSFSKPVLLLFAVRLGIDRLEKNVQETLKKFLKDERCMGLVSGKKTSSYYIIGLTPEENPVYMDPHELRSYQDGNYKCAKLHSNIPLGSLNPSMAIAFLLQSKSEYDDVLNMYKDILNMRGSTGEGQTHYVCVDGEDDFCMVEEEEEEEEVF